MSGGVIVPAVSVEVTETSWHPVGELSREQWEQAGLELQRFARSVNWLVGDWILYGERNYGETYAEAIDLTGLEYDTLKNVIWVARNVSERSRRRDLSWSHHQAVAALPETEQDMWLEAAEREGMTVARLRSKLQGVRAEEPELEVVPAMTHCARLTFKLAADSDDRARELVEQLATLLGRKGAVLSSSKVDRL